MLTTDRRRQGRPPAQARDGRANALTRRQRLSRRGGVLAVGGALRRPALGRDGRRRRRFVRLRQPGRLLAARRLSIVQEDIIRPSPWPGAAADLVAARLSAVAEPARRDRAAVCARAAAADGARCSSIAGFCGAFLVVPLCGALTIWLTYRLGRRVFDAPGIALWGAGAGRDQPGVSVSADERDERRAGDRGVDARAGAGGGRDGRWPRASR